MKKLALLAAIFAFPSLVGAAIRSSGMSSPTPGAYLAEFKADDIASSAKGATISGANGLFGSAADLISGNASFHIGGSGESLYLSDGSNGDHLPGTYTISLNTSAKPAGYDIKSIVTFAGWSINGAELANQKYTLEVAYASAPDNFVSLGTFEYQPYPDNSGGGGATKLTIDDDTGAAIALGVAKVRLTFQSTGNLAGTNGTVYHEVDIIEAVPLAVTSPTSRTVVQRRPDNTADLPVSGTVMGAPERVEARAVALGARKNLGAIWFIGDSITQSNADGDANGSPRKSLQEKLTAEGYSFTYTGHSTANIDGLPASGGTAGSNRFHYHSGISGSVIGNDVSGRTGMTQGIPAWWGQGRLAEVKPDIILIMLGTNDTNSNIDLANAPARLETLVDTIHAQPGAGNPAVFIAKIPPNNGGAELNNRVIAFNNALPGIVQNLRDKGRDVTLVDNYSPIDADRAAYMIDTLHTNTAGNGKLAETWLAGIETRFGTADGNLASGTTTAWQTIDTTFPGGAFSGTLANVPAGGWYRLETRMIVSGSPSHTASVDPFGVGDIYITAGQSNSANHGAPAKSVVDDRVVSLSALGTSNWIPAIDPQPVASGTGGSVWSRLGDMLVASQNVPVAFVNVGVGGTTSSTWIPTGGNYARLRQAVQGFPVNGFKAVLWHQGESDSIANVPAAGHQNNLTAMIARARTDAGWNIPFHIAEASFHPNTTLAQELPVNAGQRATAYADPAVFLGPRTDDFHLEVKLSDGVHFNTIGLSDHASQWLATLTGNPVPVVKNGNFESSTALADGGITTVSTSAASSPSLPGWQILAAGGAATADGAFGYYNPSASFYTHAADTNNGGVLPGMAGKHVAFFYGGSAGVHYLQTFRSSLAPDTDYTLTVALGKRLTGTFGNAKLEILADGQPLGPGTTVTDAQLTADGFADFSCTWRTPSDQPPGKQLAIRITRIDGGTTYLDFDHVRFTAARTHFSLWQENYFGSTTTPLAARDADADHDTIPNIIEYFLGTSPVAGNSLPLPVVGASGVHFTAPLNPAAQETGLDLHYSFNLADWFSASAPAHPGIVSQRTTSQWSVEIPDSITRSVFFRWSAP